MAKVKGQDKQASTRKMLKTIGDVILMGIGICIILSCIYGLYWVGKTVSFGVFYKSMVIETIHDQVKPEYLIKK